jgi:uncharacterized membrane protein
MIVQLAPDAPLLLKAAAATVLYAHIGGASLGLASGTVAVLAPKGARVHRAAGNVFFVAMLTMSAAAAVSGPFIPDRITATMGVFTFYLTATAWLAVRRPPERTGRLEVAAMVLALGVVAAYAWLTWIGTRSPGGLVDGEQSYVLAIVVGAVAALAASLDLRVIRRGGLTGAPRIARHLWRMCLALFIVWGSFAGQPKAQPEALRGEPVLMLPAFAALGLMVFWLIRVRLPRRNAAPAAA